MTTPILTVDEGMATLRATSATVAPIVDEMIAGLTGQIEDACGPIVATECTDTHDGGCSTIVLRTTPVLSVETVTENGTAVTEPDWLLENRGHLALLHRRAGSGASSWAPGTFNIEVAYTAGRFADADSISDTWKRTARSMLMTIWQIEAPAWARSASFLGSIEDDDVGVFPTIEEMLARRLPREVLTSGLA